MVWFLAQMCSSHLLLRRKTHRQMLLIARTRKPSGVCVACKRLDAHKSTAPASSTHAVPYDGRSDS